MSTSTFADSDQSLFNNALRDPATPWLYFLFLLDVAEEYGYHIPLAKALVSRLLTAFQSWYLEFNVALAPFLSTNSANMLWTKAANEFLLKVNDCQRLSSDDLVLSLRQLLVDLPIALTYLHNTLNEISTFRGGEAVKQKYDAYLQTLSSSMAGLEEFMVPPKHRVLID